MGIIMLQTCKALCNINGWIQILEMKNWFNLTIWWPTNKDYLLYVDVNLNIAQLVNNYDLHPSSLLLVSYLIKKSMMIRMSSTYKERSGVQAWPLPEPTSNWFSRWRSCWWRFVEKSMCELKRGEASLLYLRLTLSSQERNLLL